MFSQTLRPMAFAVFFAAVSSAAQADVCVTIDEARDTLPIQEQGAAIVLVRSEFEQAGERVVPAPCPTPYSVFHATLGDLIVVTISGPKGQREAIAHGTDDLP